MKELMRQRVSNLLSLFLNGYEQDNENVLKPFTLMAHKPNYILIGAYNSSGYDAEAYQEQFDDPSLEVERHRSPVPVKCKGSAGGQSF